MQPPQKYKLFYGVKQVAKKFIWKYKHARNS